MELTAEICDADSYWFPAQAIPERLRGQTAALPTKSNEIQQFCSFLHANFQSHQYDGQIHHN